MASKSVKLYAEVDRIISKLEAREKAAAAAAENARAKIKSDIKASFVS